MRHREHDLEAGLRVAAECDPAESARGHVVAHLEAERVAVEGDRLVDVVDGDVAILECDCHNRDFRPRPPWSLLRSCSMRSGPGACASLRHGGAWPGPRRAGGCGMPWGPPRRSRRTAS